MGFQSDLMGFYSDLAGFYSDLMGFYSDLMGYEWDVPSGKRLHNYGKSPCYYWENSLSMAILNS